MKSDQELATELQELRDLRRRLRDNAGPSRSGASERLTARYEEAQQLVEGGISQAAVDSPGVPALLDLHRLWLFIHDTGFREAFEKAIAESPLFGDEATFRKVADLEGRIDKLTAELASRRAEREQKRARLQQELAALER